MRLLRLDTFMLILNIETTGGNFMIKHTFKIEQDEDCESPREWDNLGTLLCTHKRYELGDIKESKEIPWYDFNSLEEAKNYIEKEYDAALILPLYLLDHSGISMRVTDFHDRWDSGGVGFIVVSKEKVRKEYSVKRISKKTLETVKKVLIGEVETYSQYLEGAVYGYQILDDKDNVIESLWGIYGYEEAEKEAKLLTDDYNKCNAQNFIENSGENI